MIATKRCVKKKFGLTADYDWALDYFGGYNIKNKFLATTNIVFSNVELEPGLQVVLTTTLPLMAQESIAL